MSYGVLIKYAYDKDKNVVIIDDASKKEVYSCPNCEIRLFIKDGVERTKHFFHPKNLSCIPYESKKKQEEIGAKHKKQHNVIEHNVKIDEPIKPVEPKAKINFGLFDNPELKLKNNIITWRFLNLSKPNYMIAHNVYGRYNLHVHKVLRYEGQWYAGVWDKVEKEQFELGWFENMELAQGVCEAFTHSDFHAWQRGF